MFVHAQYDFVEDRFVPVEKKVVKRSRGRPKGSKNKKIALDPQLFKVKP